MFAIARCVHTLRVNTDAARLKRMTQDMELLSAGSIEDETQDEYLDRIALLKLKRRQMLEHLGGSERTPWEDHI